VTVETGTAKPIAYKRLECAPAFHRIGGHGRDQPTDEQGANETEAIWVHSCRHDSEQYQRSHG
jgi:hypothetical protein